MDIGKHFQNILSYIFFLLIPQNTKCEQVDKQKIMCYCTKVSSWAICGNIFCVIYVVLNFHAILAKFLNFFSFQVGDLVLIILDERHDNYVLFTVSPTLYFLHSESLAALDLKPGECGKCQITFNYYVFSQVNTLK